MEKKEREREREGERKGTLYSLHMTEYAGSRTYGTCSLRGGPHTDPHIPLINRTPTLSLFVSSVRVICAQNSQREGRSPAFQWDIYIDMCEVFYEDCGFPT